MKEYYYAQTDADGLCCGTSQLKGKVTADNLYAVTPELFETLVVGRSRLVNGEWILDEPPAPPLDEVKAAKKQELRAARDNKLSEGLYVQTPRGTKHIRLNAEEREVIKTYKDEITTAMSGLPSAVNLDQGVFFHAEGEPHSWWPVDDFLPIAFAAMGFITELYAQLTALELLVDAQETVEAVQAVTYGMVLPGAEGGGTA